MLVNLAYEEFKIALAHNTTLEDEMPQLSSKVTMEDTVDELSSKMLTANINAHTEIHNLISSKDVEQAVDLIVRGKRVHFLV